MAPRRGQMVGRGSGDESVGKEDGASPSSSSSAEEELGAMPGVGGGGGGGGGGAAAAKTPGFAGLGGAYHCPNCFHPVYFVPLEPTSRTNSRTRRRRVSVIYWGPG